jgi:hypothetical protein
MTQPQIPPATAGEAPQSAQNREGGADHASRARGLTAPHTAAAVIRHGACGKEWTGATRGHCSGCHETFTSGAFDRHFTHDHGQTVCNPPATRGLIAHQEPWGTLWRTRGGYWTAS